MQIVLSDDLSVITAEINSYKQVAGQAMFEIGKRLKHVKEHDLAHGQWIIWLKTIDLDRTSATRMIQAYEQFGNVAHAHHLPTGKIFEMLALPESVDRTKFVETQQEIPSTGEMKTIDDMSREELREVKKALQEAERRAAQAEATAVTEKSTAQHYEKLWNQAKNQPPKVVTEQVKVVPHDYEELKQQAVAAQQLNSEVVQLKRANTEMRNEYEEKLSQQQKDDSAKKNLQKYLSEHLRALTVNHDSAIFNFIEIQGNREAHDIVMRFLSQYEAIIKKQFSEWEQLTALRAIK